MNSLHWRVGTRLTEVEWHLVLFLKVGKELYLIAKSNGAQIKQLRVFNKSVNGG